MQEINADFKELLNQASMTAEGYLKSAERSIDSVFGNGYASRHPELVSAFMATAAADHHTSIMAQQLRAAIREASESIASSISDAARELDR